MELIEALIEQLDTPGDRAQIKVFRVHQRRRDQPGRHAPLADPFPSRSATRRSAVANRSGRRVVGAAALLGGSAQQQYHCCRFRRRFADRRGAAHAARPKRIDEPQERGLPAEELTGHRCRHVDQRVSAQPAHVGGRRTGPVQSVPGPGTGSDRGSRAGGQPADRQRHAALLRRNHAADREAGRTAAAGRDPGADRRDRVGRSRRTGSRVGLAGLRAVRPQPAGRPADHRQHGTDLRSQWDSDLDARDHSSGQQYTRLRSSTTRRWATAAVTRRWPAARNWAGRRLSSFALGRENDDAGFGGLVLAASSRNISILIRALQEDREMRILSRPAGPHTR